MLVFWGIFIEPFGFLYGGVGEVTVFSSWGLGLDCILGSLGLYCGPIGLAWTLGSMGVVVLNWGCPGGNIPDFISI